LQVNGHNINFTTADGSDYYYLAYFPNFAELPPAARFPGSRLISDWPSAQITLTRKNPSGRLMPAEYLMYGETPPITILGGEIVQDIYNDAIGFR